MTLEVIGAGFGRTGTKSMKIALKQLGYARCHHMLEVVQNPSQIDYWSRASLGENMDWDKVFDGFKASVDWPSASYYKELAAYYPDAKVILTVRDPDAWYKSITETIYPLTSSVPAWILFLSKSVRIHTASVNRTIWHGTFDDRMDDQAHVTQVFRDHIEDVKRSIRPDRLLVHEAKEGWEPLCEFLGKPIPDIPYPRVNETRDMKRALGLLKMVSYLPWVLLGAGVLGLVYAVL